MAEPKSHRERAEQAAVKMSLAPENYAPIIARETFPSELVQAARRARELICATECELSGPFAHHADECLYLQRALALYPEPKPQEAQE